SNAEFQFGFVCAMLRPKFTLLSNPWCQLMPFPFFRRPVMTVIQTESPSGLLKLLCTDPLICPGGAGGGSLPRLPGQDCLAGTVDALQFRPPMVPSTKV